MNIFRHIRLKTHRARRAARKYPVVIEHKRQRGTIIVLHRDGSRSEVCDFCLGNCGQCGLTSRVGNVPAQMDAMIARLHNGKPAVTAVRS